MQYNLRGDIVFNAASLGVVYDLSKHAQSFYRCEALYTALLLCCVALCWIALSTRYCRSCHPSGCPSPLSLSHGVAGDVVLYSGHNGVDVSALAMDPRGRYVATGEMNGKPRIHLWDSVTGNSVMRLPYLHRKGRSSLPVSTSTPAPMAIHVHPLAVTVP